MKIATTTLHIALAAALWTTTAHADTVTFRSVDGSQTIEGELVGSNGFMVTVNTSAGDVSFPYSAVQCVSGACTDGIEKAATTAKEAYPELVASSPSSSPSSSGLELGVGFSSPDDREFLNALLRSTGLLEAGLSATFHNESDISVNRTDGSQLLTLELLDGGTGAGVTIKTEIPTRPGTTAHLIASDWATPNSVQDQQLKMEALAVVVSSAAGVESLSLENLARIFAGEIKNWSEVGGTNVPILTLQTGEDHPGYQSLRDAVAAPFGKTISASTLTVPNDEFLLNTLGVAPGGIAVVSTNSLGDADPLAILDSCKMPTKPNAFDIATGRYPLTISTYANVASNVNASEVGEMLDGLVTTSAPEILGAESVRTERMNAVLGSTIPRELKSSANEFIESILSADRLAMTFQDGPVGDVVAAGSRADFVRLSHAIARGDFDGQEIMFLGFSTDKNNHGLSIEQSREAADTLLAAFQDFAPRAASRRNVTFLTEGHGNVGFTECGPRKSGPASTFVEIWVRPKA